MGGLTYRFRQYDPVRHPLRSRLDTLAGEYARQPAELSVPVRRAENPSRCHAAQAERRRGGAVSRSLPLAHGAEHPNDPSVEATPTPSMGTDGGQMWLVVVFVLIMLLWLWIAKLYDPGRKR